MKKENTKKSIHNYLVKTKYRAMVLFPPLVLCLIGAIVAVIQTTLNFSFGISNFYKWLFIGSAIWMLLGMWLILWSDYIRSKKSDNE
jgi:hypothetical protein